MKPPKHILSLSLLILTVGCTSLLREKAVAPEVAIGGQSLFLRHDTNRREPQNDRVADPSPLPLIGSTVQYQGNDFQAPANMGFTWLSVPDDVGFWGIGEPGESNSSFSYQIYKIPPGFVFGLKHSETLSNNGIRVGGLNPVSSNGNAATPPGMMRQFGGDIGVPGGKGYYWFETTNHFSVTEWLNLNATISSLPRGSILALKHTGTQPNKVVQWRVPAYNLATKSMQLLSKTIDPADERGFVPEGFQRVYGGDAGADSGKGYWWLEKITSVPQLHPNVNIPTALIDGGPTNIVNPKIESRAKARTATTPTATTANRACRKEGSFERVQDGTFSDQTSLSGKYKIRFKPSPTAGAVFIQFTDSSGAAIGPKHNVDLAKAGFSKDERFGYIVSANPPGTSSNAYSITLQRLEGSRKALKLGSANSNNNRLLRFSPDETVVMILADASSPPFPKPGLLATFKDVATDSATDIMTGLSCDASYSAAVGKCNFVLFKATSSATEHQFQISKLP